MRAWPAPFGQGAPTQAPAQAVTQAVDPRLVAAVAQGQWPGTDPAPHRPPHQHTAHPINAVKLGADAMASVVLSLAATVLCCANVVALWALVTSVRAYLATNSDDLARAEGLCRQARRRSRVGAFFSALYLGAIVVYYFFG